MENYCRRPEPGHLLYHCGFEYGKIAASGKYRYAEKSAIGECTYADRDCIYMSRCQYCAMGSCLNKEAQIDADKSAGRKRKNG